MNSFRTQIVTSLIVLCSFSVGAQEKPAPMPTRADLMKKQEARMIYPFVKGSILTGVLPVSNVSMPIDAKMTYKLLFDFSYGKPEIYSQGLVNPGLEEICRILNLHSAAGIQDNKLDIFIILHGPATMTFLNESAYRERFGKENANTALVKALQQKGVKFVVCGQTLQLRELDRSKLFPGIDVAFSARTTISTLSQKGYVLFPINTMD
jgi:intracellular sulfur oxidation DsrE/DsrF family protein